MYTSFTQMTAWQKAHDLSAEIFRITVNLPRAEDYGLTSQIRRSSNSIAANLAEGYGRNAKKEKSFFYHVARGSAYETQNHLLYGQRVGYFDPDITNRLLTAYDELIHELNKLIFTLKKQP